jgi:hypothetical protein
MGYIYIAAIKHGHHHGIPRLLVTGGIRIDREYRWFIFIHVYASFHALVHHQPRFRTCSFFPLMAICHRLNFQDLWGTCFFLQTTSSTHRNSDTFGDIGQNSSKKWTGNAQTGSWVVPHVHWLLYICAYARTDQEASPPVPDFMYFQVTFGGSTHVSCVFISWQVLSSSWQGEDESRGGMLTVPQDPSSTMLHS